VLARLALAVVVLSCVMTLAGASSGAYADPGKRISAFAGLTLARLVNGHSLSGKWTTTRAIVDHHAVRLTILNDHPQAARDSQNPLGLTPAPAPGGDPLPADAGRFFVDPQGSAAQDAQDSQYQAERQALEYIASQPGTQRFGCFSFAPSNNIPDIGTAVSDYLERASTEEPGSIPLLSTYQLVTLGGCGSLSYQQVIESFAQGIGSDPAVLFLEMDSIITMPPASSPERAVRLSELQYAINTLIANCPHLVIYLDAGAADALPAQETASLLEQAGIGEINGFFLNSTHFDWTSREIEYGNEIDCYIKYGLDTNCIGSPAVPGGVRFVVNTGENGQGLLKPPDVVSQGSEVLCNPINRGLGPVPTTQTGYANVDMFAWPSRPGGSSGNASSGGSCANAALASLELSGTPTGVDCANLPLASLGADAPPTAVYWPQYAQMLYDCRGGLGPPIPTVGLASSANPSVTGQRVTYTATIVPAPDGGAVTFLDNGSVIAGCTRAPVDAGGTATCPITYATAGAHMVQAEYLGDSSFPSSESVAVAQAVRVSLAIVRSPSANSRTVTFTIACAERSGGCQTTGTLATSETRRGKQIVAVSANAKHTQRTVVVGKTTAMIAAGKTKTIMIALNRIGKRLLAQFRALPLTVTITLTADRDQSTVATSRLTLKRMRF
jgi:endoglucanase